MVLEEALDKTPGGRIEGGYDAVVLGANPDGFAAAIYLARNKFRTALIDPCTEIGGGIKRRKLDDGTPVSDGPHFISHLDRQVIDDLDLYKHGLAYSERRMETVYFSNDGVALTVDGDLARAAVPNNLARFSELVLKGGRQFADLRQALQNPNLKQNDPIAEILRQLADISPSDKSANDFIHELISDPAMQAAFFSEAVLSQGVRPSEPFTNYGLMHRYSGEAAGLPGALAFPQGGMVQLIDTFRRAAQAASVDIRTLTRVSSILVEHDKATGVAFTNGGQIRAPIIVSALNCRTTFLDLIGPGALGVDFQQAIISPPPTTMKARLFAKLAATPSDDQTRSLIRKRLVRTLDKIELEHAFSAARFDQSPGALVLEAIFPSAIDNESSDASILSIDAFPIAFKDKASEEERIQIESAIVENLSVMAPGLGEKIESSSLILAEDQAMLAGLGTAALAAERPPVARQLAIAEAAIGADQIVGLYFCGREATIGDAVSCAAARNSVNRILEDVKSGRVFR